MKSAWKVTANPIGEKMMYGVYRTIDTSKTDHSGNREYAGEFTDNRYAAQVVADMLNEKEEIA